MKNLILSCSILLLFFIEAQAQKTPEYLWGKNGGGVAISSSPDNSLNTVSIFEDTLILNGETFVSNGGEDILITQTDNAGNYKWSKQFGGKRDEYVYAIKTDVYGNIYISGQFSTETVLGNDTFTGGSSYSIFLLKLDKTGAAVWSRAIIDGVNNHIQNNVAIDNAGNVYMSASIMISDGDTLTLGQFKFPGNSSEDIYLIKYNTNGDIIWAKREGGNYDDRTYGIAIDANNNIYTSGYFTDTSYFGGIIHISKTKNNSIYFAKYDSSGNLQYLKTPTAGGIGTGLDITVANDGYLYLCGQLADTTTFGNSTISPKSTVAILVKYSPDGNVVWAKQYPGDAHRSAFRLTTDKDNNAYVVILYGNTSLAKFNSNGDLAWSNEQGPHTPCVRISGICSDINGCVFFTGTYSMNNNFFGNDTLYSTNQSIYQPGYIARVAAYPSNITDQLIKRGNITLYPNPNDGSFSISGKELSEYSSYEVVNSVGVVAYKENLMVMHNSATITTNDLPAGVYILRLYAETDIYPIIFQKQ